MAGLRRLLKLLGRRKAGTWGRVNHWKDKRAVAKAARRFKIDQEKEIDRE